MEGLRDRLIHIHSCRGITWRTMRKMLNFDPNLSSIYMLTKQELITYFTMKENSASLFYNDLHYRNILNIKKEYSEKCIKVVTILDPLYPRLLKEIYDPPWVLYCKGDLSLLNQENKISVVGTRDLSKAGSQSLEKITIPLIEKGWIIVSGLALGTDGKAHMTAISHKGKTIAVLASGYDHIYPKHHLPLANLISKTHLLITEYPPYVQPQKWQFPMRNRIISGLSKGTLVIEAKRRSGSLITADFALQQNREVFAVPGSILDERTEGTHWLIQQGAKLTKSSDDVLNEW